MAYFPNGSAGLAYQERYCFNCANADEEGCCSIWDCHVVFGYNASEAETSILNFLIPEDDKGFPSECSMFRKVDAR